MDGGKDKPERKASRREVKAKPSTLPPGAVLMTNPGEGLFTKIRRCLRIRSKGKYDFNHSRPVLPANRGSPSAGHSRSSDSSANEDADANKTSTRSSPRKVSRRARSEDKEEVLLIRKDDPGLSGAPGSSRSSTEGIKDSVLVVTIGDGNSKIEQVKAAGACCESENKENEEVFDDFDPDYETLDDIRRKIQTDPVDIPESHYNTVADVHKPTTRQPLQVRVKTCCDVSGRDSGLGSPYTDSPESVRESQAVSVNSSSASNCVGLSGNAEWPKEQGEGVSLPACAKEVVFPVAEANALMATSTSSLNCSNSALEADDLYSNAKVLVRKKSQKISQSHASFHAHEQRYSGLLKERPRSARNSLSPADFLALMEAENPQPLAPPPLPARNYSEEDIATATEKTLMSADAKTDEFFNISVKDSNLMSKSLCCDLESSKVSQTFFNNKGARPKTPRHNAFIEQGPILTGVPPLSNESVLQTDRREGGNGDACSPISQSHDIPFSLSPTDNIYEDIPADRAVASSDPQAAASSGDAREEEPDLMFIDDELSADGEWQASGVSHGALPEDVMIVSASDSMCGNDSDQSLGTADSLSPRELHFHVEIPDSGAMYEVGPSADKTLVDSYAQQPPTVFEHDKKKVEKNYSSECSSKSDACSEIDLRKYVFDGQDTNTSSSAPISSMSSVSSPSADLSSPSSSSSSSDTLNEGDSEGDPDDFERPELSPPAGPAIHVSHLRLLEDLRARTRQQDTPPVPMRRTSGQPDRRVNARGEVRSMEIPSLPSRSREADASACSNIKRRHSSSVAASRSHRDFVTSMKQLKDCGWYWGPLSYEEAEGKLIDKRDGSFLVRDSSNENYILSLSFKSMGQVNHTRIEHHKGLFSFWSQPDSHGKAQICQFIQQTIENSKNGRFLYFLRPAGPGSPPLPIQLLYPVSRFCHMPSLQHMCRFLVLRWVRRDHVDLLPLPQKVKAYLLEKQYYVETLDED